MYVVLSGAPGAGKTTLAERLAGELCLPVLSYDVILETLADSLDVSEDSDGRLVSAADDLFFALASTFPAAILDHWWARNSRRDRLLALNRPMVELFCHCADEVLVERAAARAAGKTRHPIHGDWMPIDLIGRWRGLLGGLVPLRLGSPLLELCTDAPIDLSAVVRWVMALREPSAG